MKFDSVVSQILDNLLETTGIDPAAIEPDHRLVEDLELSQGQIDNFLEAIGRDLKFSSPVRVESTSNLSLRQLVDHVKGSMSEQAAVEEAA